MTSLPRQYQQFQDEHTAVWQAYESLGAMTATDGPLTPKVRELIKLGMAAAIQAESAVHSHTHRAVEAGATPPEVEQAILLGVTTLGFPRMMTALSWAKAALAVHGTTSPTPR